jgi:UMF1 family MFS transporter
VTSALNPGVKRREVFAWAMYDFANSGYTTVVLTAVFNAYFVSVVARNADWATFAWTAALSVSYAIVMVLGPLLGAWADAHAAKKRLLAISTVVCIAGTVALAWTGPGAVAWAVAFIVVSNVAYSMGENLIAAFLPELSRPEALGKVSGWGWSLGYFGGILALGVSLAWVMTAEARGSTSELAVPGTMIITASPARGPRSIACCRRRARRGATATCCSCSRAASSTRRAWPP